MKEWYSNPGSPIKIIYEPVVQDDGSIKVVPTGKENLQDYINSFADSCDVELLVKRATLEPSLLNQRTGMYGDFTNFPKTYAEMLQKMINAEKFFYSLSPELRGEFDNDLNKFLSQCMDPIVLEKVGLIQKSDQTSFQTSDDKEVESVES